MDDAEYIKKRICEELKDLNRKNRTELLRKRIKILSGQIKHKMKIIRRKRVHWTNRKKHSPNM